MRMCSAHALVYHSQREPDDCSRHAHRLIRSLRCSLPQGLTSAEAIKAAEDVCAKGTLDECKAAWDVVSGRTIHPRPIIWAGLGAVMFLSTEAFQAFYFLLASTALFGLAIVSCPETHVPHTQVDRAQKEEEFQMKRRMEMMRKASETACAARFPVASVGYLREGCCHSVMGDGGERHACYGGMHTACTVSICCFTTDAHAPPPSLPLMQTDPLDKVGTLQLCAGPREMHATGM